MEEVGALDKVRLVGKIRHGKEGGDAPREGSALLMAQNSLLQRHATGSSNQ